MKKFIYIMLLTMFASLPAGAVESNPTLAARIYLAKRDATKALTAQKLAQELVAEGHVFVGREVQATNAFQREFNNYLDTFHDAVSMAAELYGIYYEIKRTSKLVSQVSSAMSSAPANAIAVLLKPNTSGLYGTILQTTLGAGQDIYNACISKKKLTAQDRNKMLTSARQKIKAVNKDLAKLVIVLRYTTLEDIWYSIRTRAKYMDPERKHTVIERCYDNWKHNIR
jgi:hypothetical protein